MSNTRVLIIEDEPLIAEDIADLLQTKDYTNAGIAYDSETGLDMLLTRYPDIVLLDIQIDGTKNGIEIAQIIRKNYKLPFVFITSHADKMTLDEAKKTLPYGYIVKPFNENDLVSTIEMVLYRFSNEHSRGISTLEEINQKINNNITQREYECLTLLYDGLTNKQISEKQFVSVNTVKTHLKNLFLKLEVRNRVGAIQKMATI